MVVVYSVVSYLVWLTNARINPVHSPEAFPSPNPIPFLISPSVPLDILWSLDQNEGFNHPNKWMFRIPLILGSYIFESVPFLVKRAQPDHRLRVFPLIPGYPCYRAVNPSHFRSGRQFFCLVVFHSDPSVGWLKWKADFGFVGIPISDTD